MIKRALLVLIVLTALAPFGLALLGTFKSDAEIVADPPTLLPRQWTAQNWARAWHTDFGLGAAFPRWLLNTAIVAFGTAVMQLVFCSMAAYAFARLRFPGRDGAFALMLATLMIPSAVVVIPAYALMDKLRLINTYWSLLMPNAVSAGNIFLLTQFLRTVPRELEEAATIDGATRFQTYRDVVLPLARPALLTMFVLQLQSMWNAYLPPLLYLTTPRMWVLSVAIGAWQQQYKTQWNVTLAASILAALPALVLFAFFSRHYLPGIHGWRGE